MFHIILLVMFFINIDLELMRSRDSKGSKKSLLLWPCWWSRKCNSLLKLTPSHSESCGVFNWYISIWLSKLIWKRPICTWETGVLEKNPPSTSLINLVYLITSAETGLPKSKNYMTQASFSRLLIKMEASGRGMNTREGHSSKFRIKSRWKTTWKKSFVLNLACSPNVLSFHRKGFSS